MSDNESMDAKCPKCGGMRDCDILYLKHVDDEEDAEAAVYGWEKYFVLRCKGCKRIFFLNQSWFSEWVESDGSGGTVNKYYPQVPRRRQNKQLKDLDLFSDECVCSLTMKFTKQSINGFRSSLHLELEL